LLAFGDVSDYVSGNGEHIPFAKVAKQMDNGLEDGIASYFTVIPIVFKNLVRAPPSKS
jgi:hypothetical protein